MIKLRWYGCPGRWKVTVCGRGRREEGEGGSTEPRYRSAITVDRKASRNRWPSRRLCVSTTLDEIIKGSCSIRNKDLFATRSFGRGVLVIYVGLRFFMFFFFLDCWKRWWKFDNKSTRGTGISTLMFLFFFLNMDHRCLAWSKSIQRG